MKFKAKDTKQQKLIMIRPSVKKTADQLQKKLKASSFSDLVEKLIIKESENG